MDEGSENHGQVKQTELTVGLLLSYASWSVVRTRSIPLKNIAATWVKTSKMYTSADITKNVHRLMNRFDTRDPFRIASKLGIEIMYTDALKRLKGMCRVIKRKRFVILNNKNSDKMNRIVCAHELRHDQLHREYAKANMLR